MITDAIKALDESMTLEVLGLPFGTDRQGQVFDEKTEIGLEIGDEVPVYYWHGFGDRASKSVPRIGKAIYQGVGDMAGAMGHKFKAILDSAFEASSRIYEDAKKGMARASSDSSSHLVRPTGMVGKPGYVSSWPIFAMSLMDGSVSQTAVNPRAVAFAAAKAYMEEVDIEENDVNAGEADAHKAGAAIARRNQGRISKVRDAWKAQGAALDELETEFSTDESGSDEPAKAPATKSQEDNSIMEEIKSVETSVEPKAEPKAEAQIDVAAIKAELTQELTKEFDAKLAEANRKPFAVPAVNLGGRDEAAVKATEDAFMAYVRGEIGKNEYLAAAKATMNVTTDGQGGYLVPTKYSNEIVKPLNDGSVLRQAGAKVIQVEGTDSFKVPSLVNTTRAVVKGESTAYVAIEPTLAEVEFTPWKFTRLAKVTEELLAFGRVDVFGSILAPDAANAFVLAENADFVGGNGSATAQGITVGAAVGVTAAATNAITAEEVIDLYHSVGSQYRRNGSWLMSDATLKTIRKFRESGTTGAFLWQPALSSGEPSTLMGRPVYTVSDMPAIATGVKPIVFGDFSYYWIADFNGGAPALQRLNELYAGTGEIGFRWTKYVDGNVMLSAAIKSLIMA